MIVIEQSSHNETLAPMVFDSEKQLEDVVCKYPQLLGREGDAPLCFVSRQIQMSSGIMDVLLIDGAGLPIAVEVKLGRNAQARREIVGQLIDYVSTMTEYTVDELDDLVRGRISIAIDAVTDNDGARKKVWQSIGANLRGGLARYILVLDRVPAELGRIIRFLAKRSNLDIRLVEISKYVSATGQIQYVPHNLVEAGDSGADKMAIGAGTVRPELHQVITAYEQIDGAYPLKGSAKAYRQILPPAWPPGVHYEFLHRAAGVQVEIHLEGARVRHLVPLLEAWEETPPAGFDHSLVWDANWYDGRVTVQLPTNSAPEEIARTMADLIRTTEGRISDALNRAV